MNENEIEQLTQRIQILENVIFQLVGSDKYLMNKTVQLIDGRNFQFGITTGTKIGTATTQKLGFYNKTPISQQSGIAVSAAGIHAAIVNLGLFTA